MSENERKCGLGNAIIKAWKPRESNDNSQIGKKLVNTSFGFISSQIDLFKSSEIEAYKL